jgi:hypothetical protein
MWLVVLLCLGASCALGAPPAVAEAKPKAAISDAQVAGWVKLWQKRLHLEDWKVEARIVRTSDLRPDTLGNLKWNSVNHTATIKVLNPADYDMPVPEVAEDIEYTVVHELVHLQLSVLPRDLNRKDVEETVVNKISDALMLMERGDAFRARSQPVVPYRTKPSDPLPAPDVAGRQMQPVAPNK